MRFILAIISFVVAALLIGTGIAQQTIFLSPDKVVASVTVDSSAPVTVIDGATLNEFPRSQTLGVGGSAQVFAAYGRTADVEAWVGDSSYNAISYDETTGELTSKLVTGTENVVPDPTGSDLWLSEYSQALSLSQTVKVPDTISFVIVSDGQSPAPADISLSWPLDNSTPWAIPLLIGGGIVLLIGLILLLWAITTMRRSRGPRRKQQKMPKLPKQPRYKPSKRPKALPASTSKGRRSSRTTLIAVPFALVGLLAVSGCTSTTAETAAPLTAEPTPVSTEAASTLDPPAVTELQANRIYQRILEVANKADEDLDAKLLKTRFAGPALALRTADYKVKKLDKTEDLPSPFFDGSLQIVLPQQTDTWPRTVFVVVTDEEDESVAPLALMLIQEDARSQYLVNYAMNLEPGVTVPDVAPPSVGASRLLPDVALYTLLPQDLAVAYGDILNKDDESEYFDLFNAEGDTLRTEVGLAAKKKALKALPDTAKLTFTNAAGLGDIIVFGTNDSGAIVAVELDETETVKPVETGAAVNAPKGVKALAGKAVSTTGFEATYGDQLLFYVPSTTVGGQITLLGYDQGLIDASEVKKK